MKNPIRFLNFLSIVSLGVLVFSNLSYADVKDAPKQSIEGFLGTVRSMEFPVKDEAKHAELVKKASGYLDWDGIGQKAMTAHWNEMTQSERDSFTSIFHQLIEAIAYRSSNRFLQKAKVSYPEATPDSSGVLVKSLVRQEGEEIDMEVLYHLSEQNADWKINDVILDGVSIVEDLKYQFDKIIGQSKVAGLLETMQKRLVDAQKHITSPEVV